MNLILASVNDDEKTTWINSDGNDVMICTQKYNENMKYDLWILESIRTMLRNFSFFHFKNIITRNMLNGWMHSARRSCFVIWSVALMHEHDQKCSIGIIKTLYEQSFVHWLNINCSYSYNWMRATRFFSCVFRFNSFISILHSSKDV